MSVWDKVWITLLVLVFAGAAVFAAIKVDREAYTYEECEDKGREVIVHEEEWRTLDGSVEKAVLSWTCQ